MKKLHIIIISFLSVLLILMTVLYFKKGGEQSSGLAASIVKEVKKEATVSVDTNLTQEEQDVANASVAAFNSFIKDSNHPMETIEKALMLKNKFIGMTEGKHETKAYKSAMSTVLDVIPVMKQFCIAAMTYGIEDNINKCGENFELIEEDNQHSATSQEAVLENLVISLGNMKKHKESEKISYFLLSKYPSNHDTYRNLQITYAANENGFENSGERGCYMYFLLNKSASLGNSLASNSLSALPKVDCSNYSFDEIFSKMSQRALNKEDSTPSIKKIGFNR